MILLCGLLASINSYVMYFTCQDGEVCRAGDGDERRGHVCGFDPVLRHGVQVRRVHVPVVVPPEAIKGDEQ